MLISFTRSKHLRSYGIACWAAMLWCLLATGSLSAQTVYSFTNCGSTGHQGPTQVQVDQAYANTNLAGNVTINTQGIQEWTVPATGAYQFEVVGATGGNQNQTAVSVGHPAKLTGSFYLNQGDVIKILVGQHGFLGSFTPGWGGGGGTFVVTAGNTPMMIAGGAGSGHTGYSDLGLNVQNASLAELGQVGSGGGPADWSPGYGATGGRGGDGAGLLGNGTTGNGSLSNPVVAPHTIPQAFINGGLGDQVGGGFGGGGGVTNVYGGGGGGYSGGRGGFSYPYFGGGGGSLNNSCAAQTVLDDNDIYTMAHGRVTITAVEAGNACVPVLTCPDNVEVFTDAGLCEATATFGDPTICACQETTVTLTAGLSSGSTFPIGVTTNTFTASNPDGTATCSFTVTVSDEQPPVMACQSAAVVIDGVGGTATLQPEVLDNGSYAPCGDALTFTASQTEFGCSDIGQQTVVLTASTAGGQPATCSTTVTVTEAITIEAVCQDVTVSLDANGNYQGDGLIPGSLIGDATDDSRIRDWLGDVNATGALLYRRSVDGASASAFHAAVDGEGATIVLIELDNGRKIGGYAASDWQGFGYQDEPTNFLFSLTNNFKHELTGSSYYAQYNSSNSGPIWGGGNDLYINSDMTTGYAYFGQTYTCRIGSAYSSTCYNDFAGSYSSWNVVELEVYKVNQAGGGSLASLIGANSTIGCGAVTMTATPANFDCNDLGNHTVTLTIDDNNGTSDKCTATVTVVDDRAPVLTCSSGGGSGQVAIVGGSSTFRQALETSLTGEGYTVIYQGSSVPSSTILGNTDIVFLLRTNGNTNLSTWVNNGGTLITEYTANNWVFNSAGLLSGTSSYYSNGTTVNFTNTEVGQALTTAFGTSSYGDGGATQYFYTVYDPGQDIAIHATGPGNQPVVMSGAAESGQVVAITYDYNDVGSSLPGSNTETFLLTVLESVVPAAGISIGGDGTATLTLENSGVTVSDNCGMGTTTFSQSVFDCSEVGEHTVTVTATDLNGNSNTCETTVLITDTPQALCQDMSVTLDVSTGVASITTADIDAGTASGCNGDFTLSLSQTEFSCDDLGDNTVTLTATDDVGLSTLCEATVSVGSSPVVIIDCQDVTVSLNENGVYTGGRLIPESLIGDADDDSQIRNWLGAPNASGELLYRRSTDGASASAFHSAVDGEGATVVLIELDNGRKIGGYAASDWQGSGYRNEPTNFLFSLTNDFKHEIIGDSNYAQYNTSSYGPTWGGGHDLYVGNNMTTGYANIGLYYACRTGTYQSTDCRNDFTGSYSSWSIVELEVYKVDLGGNGGGTDIASLVGANAGAACGNYTLEVDQSMFDCNDLGANTVTLTVTDAGGTSSTCTATVTVEDDSAPVLSCGGAGGKNVAIVGANSDFRGALSTTLTAEGYSIVYNGLTVPDAATLANADITFLMRTPGNNDLAAWVSNGGVLLTEWSSNAWALNTANLLQATSSIGAVYIALYTPVVFTSSDLGQALSTAFNAPSYSDVGATEYFLGYTNLGPDVEVHATRSPNEPVVIGGVSGAGYVLAISYDYSDIFGSLAGSPTETFLLTALENVGGAGTTLTLDANGTATLDVADLNIAATDNCGIASTVLSQTLFDCADLGEQTVTYTALDAAGNATTCNVTVTVETDAPTAACANTTVQLGAGGTATISTTDIDNGSTTGCDVPTLSLDQMVFDCSHIGSNTVTLTVMDAGGATATCTATVTVQNSAPLTANCQDATVQLDANGNGSITVEDIDNGSAVACGNVTLSLDQTAFTCLHVGAQTVTLTVTDDSNNSATCTATVTVEDNVAPTASCQAATVQLDANGAGSITAADIDNGSTDACGIPMPVGGLSLNQSTFGCADVGSNTVTLTVVDQNGNSSSCTAQVTVEDNVPPVALCQDPTIQLDANGVATLTPSQVNNNSSDACGFPLDSGGMSLDITSFDCSQTGMNLVTLTVTDNNGNSSTCTSAVDVVDNIDPVFTTCPDDIELTAIGGGCSGLTSWTLPTFTDNCPTGLTMTCTAPGATLLDNSTGLFPVGTTTVTCIVTDAAGNTDTCTFNVMVTDTQSPFFTGCPVSAIQVDAEVGTCGATVNWQPISANDNCVGIEINQSHFSGNNFPVGSTPVTYTATDAAGLQATCEFTVVVSDTEAPEAVCNNISVVLVDRNVYTLTQADIDALAAGTTDNCAGMTYAITAGTTMYDCDDRDATFMVTLTATDAAGATDACTAQVTVTDPNSVCNDPPTAVCDDIVVEANANCEGTAVAADFDGGSSDADGDDLTFSLDVAGPYPLGLTVVMLTVSDGEFSHSCSATITVEDRTPPAAVCQSTTVQLDANGNGSITSADIDAGSSDACGIASLSVSPANFDCSTVGANVVTMTVVDNLANAATCTATVTVEDNVAPIATCQNITVILDPNGTGTITPAEVDGGSYDACGIANLSVDITSFTCSDVGMNGVVLTVVDNNGNSSTCSAVVTVVDNSDPVALCQSATVQLDANGNGSLMVTDVDAGSADACGLANMSLDQTTFDCSHIGVNAVTLTLTVEDNNENSATCVSMVTVEDYVAPTALCQSATVQLDANGQGSITVSNIDAGSNDACGLNSLSLDNSSFDCTNVGTNTVAMTIVDNNGNSSTCTATVTVEDNVAPTALCQSTTVQLDANGNGSITASDIDAGSNDACGVASLSLSKTTFDCSNIGASPLANGVTLTVVDNNGNTSTCSTTVTVEDNVEPTALCQSATVQLDANGTGSVTISDVDAGSNDACGIGFMYVDQTTFDCSDVGAASTSNAVVLTVFDNNGNTSSCLAEVTVEDNVAPSALCQSTSVQLDPTGNSSITISDIDAGSNDACGVAILSLDQTTFGCSHVGANTVTLTVVDINGNSSTCTALVTVEDMVDPTAVCQDTTVQLDAAGAASVSVAAIDAGSTDNCMIASMTLDQTTFDCSHVGANTVTLTVTDDFANTATCTATVTVEDNVAPTVLCQPATVQLDANGMGSITVSDIDAGSNDACGLVSLVLDQTDFGCAQAGTTATPIGVTLTATDTNGNSASCTSMVTVEDNVPPLLTCFGQTITFNGEAEILLDAADLVDATDACGIASTDLWPATIGCDALGTIVPVLITVTDMNGIVSNCTVSVATDGLPCGYSQDPDGIDCEDGNSTSYNPLTNVFTMTSTNCYMAPPFNSDGAAFAGATLCGDGEIVTLVNGVIGGGWAGLMMRETMAPGSKKFALSHNGSNFVRREVRQVTNGAAPMQPFPAFNKRWLRLVRQGNQFSGYVSSNGVAWQQVMAANIDMASCIDMGMFVTNPNLNSTVIAQFMHTSTSGGATAPLQGNTQPMAAQKPTHLDAILRVYPTPTTGEVTVELPVHTEGIEALYLFDSYGRQVLVIPVADDTDRRLRLDLSYLPDGVYHLKARDANGESLTQRVIIQ